jgi:carbamoylphosphate synthase small subunit
MNGPKSLNMSENLTQFDKVETKAIDCSTGYHRFDPAGMEPGEGKEAIIKLVCTDCGAKKTIISPLNVNDLMQEPTPEELQKIQQITEQGKEGMVIGKDGLTPELMQQIARTKQAQEADDFWSKMKEE